MLSSLQVSESPITELRLLGPIAVLHDGVEHDLPQSKKTRALLAYLATTDREHRRDRLCSLLWDVVDDPRGALRWCLSKLRRVVDDKGVKRLITTRESVRLDTRTVHVDVLSLHATVTRGLKSASDQELLAIAEGGHGEFLEGLELPDFHEFQAWNMAQRSRAREDLRAVLFELVERLGHQPEEALHHARALVHVDPLSEEARASLLRLLVRLGRHDEAAAHYQAGIRLYKELGAGSTHDLDVLWAEIKHQRASTEPAVRTLTVVTRASERPAGTPPPAVAPASRNGLCGRTAEQKRLRELIAHVEERGTARVALLSGEPGIGKTRLLDEMIAHADQRGAVTFRGRCYEIEGNRPFGPWQDALAGIIESRGGNELFFQTEPSSAQSGREQLFSRVVDLIADAIVEAEFGVLVFDDLQWLDRDSAELLHFVARHNLQRPLCLLLGARAGEVDDNGAVTTLLRSLRRDLHLEELALEPLGEEEIGNLVGQDGKDRAELYAASAGNPLFALEIARARALGLEDLPTSIADTILERLERLPAAASDVLRWAAVAGQTFSLDLLAELSSLSQEEMLDALESLERHGLLALEDGANARVTHDVVRAAVYSSLSGPRRRLMHRRIAESLAGDRGAAENIARLAHHASLAGEARIAVSACIDAGRNALRMFAYADADNLARRGLALVAELGDPERTAATIELYEIRNSARKPLDPAAMGTELEELARHALDLGLAEHARLAFHLLAYLRWDTGSFVDARRHMLEAARVSRSTNPGERATALAEAARCLALLEKDLAQAEAFTLEARALSIDGNASNHSLPCATGMLQAYRGQYSDAEKEFRAALDIARRTGHRHGEFESLECLCMLEIDTGRYADALEDSTELCRLADRLPDGSEVPMARALVELARFGLDRREVENLDVAIEALRLADAKFRLAFVASRAAIISTDEPAESATETHDPVETRAWARGLAQCALDAARALHRPTEIAVARAALIDTLDPAVDSEAEDALLRDLRTAASSEISSHARRLVQGILEKHAGLEPPPQGSS